MRSARLFVFDTALVAFTVVLLVALVVGVLRQRRGTGSPWAPMVAAAGLVGILALFGSDLIDAITGSNRGRYPDRPLALLYGAMAAVAIAATAVYDSLTTRAEQVGLRLLPETKRGLVLPVILGIAAITGVVSLAIIEPAESTEGASQTPVSLAEPARTSTTSGSGRPATIRMLPSEIGGATIAPETPELVLTAITEPGALRLPTFAASPPGDDRLFVIERFGRLYVVDDDGLRPDPLLDIGDRVRAGQDGGLVGLAFHPEFADNGRAFLFYTDLDDDNRLVEIGLDPETATVVSGPTELLFIEQATSQHAGGTIAFGPDGFLYVSVGDGGTHGDPEGDSQNPDSLLGGILRIDVDGGSPYAIPDGNAFDGRDPNETFAFGLRNPYRFFIDAPTNRMFIGDVGQFYWEEVNVLDLDEPGVNFGWAITEGHACFLDDFGWVSECDRTGLRTPIVEYQNIAGFTNRPPTGPGCAILGGPMYRGAAIPEIEGRVFYADYCRSWIMSFGYDDGRVTDRWAWEPAGDTTLGTALSFAVDAGGEMYVLTSADGMIYRIDRG